MMRIWRRGRIRQGGWIRSSRALLTSKVRVWRKAVLKCKAMPTLSSAHQAHLWSSGDLNMEKIQKHQDEVDDALVELVTICGLVEGEDDEF